MNLVSIVDSRPRWMIREDRQSVCLEKCHLFFKCQSKMGSTCRQLGGTDIPRFFESHKLQRK